MRWGVRDEATDDHQTVNLCSREIRNCQRMSLGPNFVALIGNKYGFRPLCSRIKSTEYRALRRCLIELDINTDFLDTWYKEDLNAVPAEYLLQPISSILKNFTNKAEPELQSVDQRIWQAIQERIHELLLVGSSRLVAQGRLSEQEQLMRFSISVTEREVIEGCLDVKDAKQRCLVYVRSIRDIGDHLQSCLDNLASFTSNLDSTCGTQSQKMLSPSLNDCEADQTQGAGQDADNSSGRRRSRSDSQSRRASLKIGADSINLTTSQSQNAAERKVERTRKLLGKYVDLLADNNVWKLDEDAQAALRVLREKKLTGKLRLNGKNLNRFEVSWHEQEGVSLKSEEHKKYLNELTDHFYNSLSSMIRKSARSSQQQQLKMSGLLGEVLQHSHYACHVSRGFAGRTKELGLLRDYILGTRQDCPLLPMLIYGVGGSGKTSFLAKAATQISDWLEQQQQQQELSADCSQSACVISRFCGTTPSSSSMVGVLSSVCRQLQYNFYQLGSLAAHRQTGNHEAQLPFGPIPDDFVRLVFSFRQLLDNCRHKLHRRRLFVIVLDSLEHLSQPANRCSVEVKYSWLTSLAFLPANVRLIVSCSSESSSAAASWRDDFAYLKAHFLRAYFDLSGGEKGASTFSGRGKLSAANEEPRWAEHRRRMVEQSLVKGGKSSVGPETEISKLDERLHSLRLITTCALRFMSSISRTSGQRPLEADHEEQTPTQKVCWIIHIKPLGSDWAKRVLQNWLSEAGRNLTQQQWSIVEKSFGSCSRPIFVKLAFGEVINWKSYSMQNDTHGLTFGSSLLAKQQSNTSAQQVEVDHLASTLKKLSGRTGGNFEANNLSDELLRWQIICMEQEWLSYLEFKSREEAAKKVQSSPEAKNQMTIRIGGVDSADEPKSSSSSSWSRVSLTAPSICRLSSTIDDAICQLFARIEIRHGFLLTKHSLSYLTAARNGICENELEDLLSLDDVVLDDVFQYHLPPVRRIPPLLWTRIRSDLPDYLSERDADGTFVVNWHHGQFRDATQRRYLSANEPQQVSYIHSMMADYFLGRWADKPKPFKCTKQQALMAAEQLESAIQQSLRDSQTLGRRGSGISPDRPSAVGRLSFGSSAGNLPLRAAGSSISVHNRLRAGSNQNEQRFQWMQAKADRRVPHQPLFFDVGGPSDGQAPEKSHSYANSNKRYNLRKLTELPYHLIRSARFADLANEILFNYKWLFCSLDALGLQNVLSDFDETTSAVQLAIANLKSPSTVAVAVGDEHLATLSEEQDLEFLEALLRQLSLLNSAIRLSCGSIVHGQTRMLAPQLLGRLLPVLKGKSADTKHLGRLLEQCDRDGCLDNALLPLAHCLQSPEGIQSSSLEGHSFAVMAMALTNDQRHLLAVSNKFIMWDISTGELSRVIEPRIDGSMMRSLRLGADNKYALVYTSNDLVLLLDILTQQVTSYRKLVGADTIRGLELVDKGGATRFIVWSESRWLVLSVLVDDEATSRRQQRLSMSQEFCSELDEFSSLQSRRIHFLATAEEEDRSTFLVLLGTRPVDGSEFSSRISTFRVARSKVEACWNLELWSDRIENVSAFCSNESLTQLVFVDSQTNDIHLKRRRQISWSKSKLLRASHHDLPVLSLRMSGWHSGETGTRKVGSRRDKEIAEELRLLEQKVDDIDQSTNREDIETSPAFEVELGTAKEAKNEPTGPAIVIIYETSVTVIHLGRDKFDDCHLELPKDVRNIQVEPNRCQMETLVVCNEASGEKYLVLSFNRRLLFYSLLRGGKLLDSAEAHGARIVELLPIRAGREECLVATASMDKSVKIWNLVNLAKNSPSLDKLDSPIESILLSNNQSGWAVCLSRNECALFDWRTLKLQTKLIPPNSEGTRIVKGGLSSNGRYLCLATRDSLYLCTLSAPKDQPRARQDQTSCSKDNFIWSQLHKLQAAGLVKKLVFFQQDSRLIATVVCLSGEEENDNDDSTHDDEKETATTAGGHRLSWRIQVLCFAIPDGRLMFAVDHLSPNSISRQSKDLLVSSGRKLADNVRLPVLTRDQAHIVTVEFAPTASADNKRRISSRADKSLPLQLGVYSSRDGKLAYSVGLSELELSQQRAPRRDSTGSQTTTGRVRCVSISADQFGKLKAIQYLDRQSVVALIDRTKGLCFIVDLLSRQLILSTSAWNGKRLTSDGRFGLGCSQTRIASFREKPQLVQQQNRLGDSAVPMSLLQLLEMRQCTPIRSLLASDDAGLSSSPGAQTAAQFATDDVLCGFNSPNDGYVYFCDQRRRRLLLVRLSDGQLIANYKLAACLSSLKWADDGFVLVAGLADGSLLSLAVIDPTRSDSALLRLAQFPSRKLSQMSLS